MAAVYLSLMNEYLYIMMYTNMFRIDVSSWHYLYVYDVYEYICVNVHVCVHVCVCVCARVRV